MPKNKQSLLDVVLQHHGNLEALFDVMNANGFTTLLPDMSSGVEIQFNQRSTACQFYLQNNIFPSTLPDNTGGSPTGSFSFAFSNSFNI